MFNIVVLGMGYVGLSHAVMLAKNNIVKVLDINEAKIEMLNRHESPIKDTDIKNSLRNDKLNISAEFNSGFAYSAADIVIIALPTNYNEETKELDTHIIEESISDVRKTNTHALIVLKSTIPIGFMHSLTEKIDCKDIVFCPEFLREGQALHDNLYPSRVVVGTLDGKLNKKTEQYLYVLKKSIVKKDTEFLIMGYSEAEAVKIFSNTYLAMRIGFFNELDTYAECKGLDAQAVINGVCHDPRIGMGYNNPSFGYGGYCLPKDTKQLLANYNGIPNNLIEATVDTNKTRKNYIINRILEMTENLGERKTVGLYRLQMKSGSDNIRESCMLDILDALKGINCEIMVYEPLLTDADFDRNGFVLVDDLNLFKNKADVILANRYGGCLSDVKEKVYTRDIFGTS